MDTSPDARWDGPDRGEELVECLRKALESCRAGDCLCLPPRLPCGDLCLAGLQIDRLDPKPGEVYVARLPAGAPPDVLAEAARHLDEWWTGRFPDVTLIVLFVPGCDLGRLSEEQLAAAGLARIDRPLTVEAPRP